MRPTTIVIFGASGDLTSRKLIPAICRLVGRERLSPDLQIVGFSRSRWTSEEFRQKLRSGMESSSTQGLADAAWSEFAARLHYVSGDYSADKDFRGLDLHLRKLEGNPANRLYYMATPPQFFLEIVNRLGSCSMLTEEDGWRRVVIEKPFGRDLGSARDLNQSLHSVLQERQIYRIDHYLAKETVQNILVFRFGNTIFEPIWNRNLIDHVQISAAETVRVGRRGGYYDQAGVLRDMFQNHLLQLLSFVAMEPPASFDANALRNEKVKVLSAVRILAPSELPEHTVRAQYSGYREESGVARDSTTATFAALRLHIDNWRWQGVPFYLRSGKALAKKATEIVIQFKAPPHLMFPLPSNYEIKSNLLALCIQPHEGIHLRFEAKVPDTAAEMRSVDMDFHYEESFGPNAVPEAYERLLLNAVEGDAALFSRSDEIEAAWQIIDPILKGWEDQGEGLLAAYEEGSWGPLESDALLAREGRAWRHSCAEH